MMSNNKDELPINNLTNISSNSYIVNLRILANYFPSTQELFFSHSHKMQIALLYILEQYVLKYTQKSAQALQFKLSKNSFFIEKKSNKYQKNLEIFSAIKNKFPVEPLLINEKKWNQKLQEHLRVLLEITKNSYYLHYKKPTDHKILENSLYDLVIQIIRSKKNIFINCFDINGELIISISEGALGIKRSDRLSSYSGRFLGKYIVSALKNKLISNKYYFSQLVLIIKNYSKDAINPIINTISLEFKIKKVILQPSFAFNGLRKKKRKRN